MDIASLALDRSGNRFVEASRGRRGTAEQSYARDELRPILGMASAEEEAEMRM